MHEKERICQNRLPISGLCEGRLLSRIFCHQVVVTSDQHHTWPVRQITITKMTNLSHGIPWNPMEGLFIDEVLVSITFITDESVGHITLQGSISRQTLSGSGQVT